ncbi:MAG: magnesium and cobalt transport protein CorA [Chitinophagales bacterium]
MKRKSKKKNIPTSIELKDINLSDDFFSNIALIEYNEESYERKTFTKLEDIKISDLTAKVEWLNIYGFQFPNAIKRIIYQNKLDEFLFNLATEEDHRNKVIELQNSFFLSIKSVHFEDKYTLESEQLMFIVSPTYIWSIQEKSGDHFEHIRTRLRENKGIARKKGADYLLYLMIDAMIENYYGAYEKLIERTQNINLLEEVRSDPEYAAVVENNKKSFFLLKKAIGSLREAINQVENVELENFNNKYFTELKEQCSFMMDDIDFNLQQLESSINLIFTIQSHRLNEVMRTLTVLSVIFIPLTFLAGIYGMNFKYIPELNYHYGYFVLLGIMLIVALMTIYYFKRKNWFN